jgi:hypothetical protein
MAKYGKWTDGVQNGVTIVPQETFGPDGQIVCVRSFQCKMCTTEEGMIGRLLYGRRCDVSPVVNLYIAEVKVLFAGHRTIEVQSRARLPRNPRSEK